jgi:predicted acyl esterase
MSLSPSEYGIVVEKNVIVPMRDGIRLATEIYRPAINGHTVPGPIPTILGRTSYDKRWRHLWQHLPGYGHDGVVNPSQLSHTAMPASTAAIVSPASHRFATTDRSLSYRLDHLSFH